MDTMPDPQAAETLQALAAAEAVDAPELADTLADILEDALEPEEAG